MWDTATACIKAESKDNIFIPEASGIYYVGINMGNCNATGKYHFLIDEVKMIDQDAIPSAVGPQVDEKGNSLSVYPNPATTAINFSYTVTENSMVELSLINILGQEVAHVFKDTRTEGSYRVSLDCSDLTNGMYYGMLKVNNAIIKKKIMVLK